MTKEEKIKEAWGELYEKYGKYIDSDGGLFWTHLYDSDKININLDLLGNITYRPKSLQGIESNNGWSVLKGLKNEIQYDGDFWIINKYGNIELWLQDQYLEIGYATHWKPIEKPKPPII